MSEITQSTRTPVSKETGFLKRKWKSILFFFEKHAFESKLESVLTAAAGHEGNQVPPGDHQYHLLSAEADLLCTEFANRWGLDIELLKARIAGLAKLHLDPAAALELIGYLLGRLAVGLSPCGSLHFGADVAGVPKAIVPGREISSKNTFCRCFTCTLCCKHCPSVLIVLFASKCGKGVRVAGW
jgi:hypothetical protein